MSDLLYNLIIKPIEYLIETIFWVMYSFFGNAGVAIIAVSLTVSTLVLPLYLRSDAIQESEQKKQKAMEKWLKHIRKFFKGDERYMIENAYYREMDYRPLYALRSAFSLLLQIPFFIAGYHYLSTLSLLSGISFGPIADLGRPDGLIALGVVHINLLPILMTVINCVSGFVYTRDLPLRAKLQIYVLASVFLVLLYRSPSGLVLYWTMNNLYSLCKNIVMKYIKNPAGFLGILLSGISVAFVLYLLISGKMYNSWFGRQGRDYEAFLIWFVLICVFNSPLVLFLWKKKHTVKQDVTVTSKSLPVLLEIALALFCGVYIPLSVISASPVDFVNVYNYMSPLHYVFTTGVMFAGVFIVWGGIILYISDKRGKDIYSLILFVLLLMFIANFMLVKPDIGTVSNELSFDHVPKYGKVLRVANLLMAGGIAGASFVLWKFRRNWMNYIVIVVILSLLGICTVNMSKTGAELKRIVEAKEEAAAEADLTIPLSKEGKNVVVIMLDRAIGAYIPYLFAEKPELRNQYDGFVYYPNTVSYGQTTSYGSPALYGGYDYSAAALNARDDVKLRDKQNEAITLLPRLLGEEGYRVTTWDPPYANYCIPSDLSVFDEYPYVNAVNVEGRYTPSIGQENYLAMIERNFFFYSIFKVVPAMLQDEVYDSGEYMAAAPLAANNDFLKAWEVLEHMPEVTVTEGVTGNTLFMMDNNTTHAPAILQLPDYTPAETVDNTGFADWDENQVLDGKVLDYGTDNRKYGISHYHCNMAAIMSLGRWFDKLREEGVYDNTRIIIVADHGRALGQFEDMLFLDELDVEGVNALFMVKDFGATGFVTDDSFKTNADTPVMALEGLIEDPVNPYTGNAIVSHSSEGADIICAMDTKVQGNEDTRLWPYDAFWYHVEDNILDPECWTEIFPEQ